MKFASVKSLKTDCSDLKVSICLSVLGNKWTALILNELTAGEKRFVELERALNGISPRSLSQRLEQLVEHKIISKQAFNEVPPRVEYKLTDKGHDLVPILKQMEKWGDKYPAA